MDARNVIPRNPVRGTSRPFLQHEERTETPLGKGGYRLHGYRQVCDWTFKEFGND